MNAEATWNREYRNQYMAGVEYAELLENGDLRSEYVTGEEGPWECRWVTLEGDVNGDYVTARFYYDPNESPLGWTLNALTVNGLPAIDNTEVARAIASRNGIDW